MVACLAHTSRLLVSGALSIAVGFWLCGASWESVLLRLLVLFLGSLSLPYCRGLLVLRILVGEGTKLRVLVKQFTRHFIWEPISTRWALLPTGGGCLTSVSLPGMRDLVRVCFGCRFRCDLVRDCSFNTPRSDSD